MGIKLSFFLKLTWALNSSELSWSDFLMKELGEVG